MQAAPVASAPTSVPLVNGSPAQVPVPVPVKGGVPLPGIANTTLARPEVGCVHELLSLQEPKKISIDFALRNELGYRVSLLSFVLTRNDEV